MNDFAKLGEAYNNFKAVILKEATTCAFLIKLTDILAQFLDAIIKFFKKEK